MVIFYLKFSMMNSKLNECESECKSKPESESTPANLNLNSVPLQLLIHLKIVLNDYSSLTLI